MTTQAEQDAMDKIIERGQKILALAKRGGTEAECAVAMSKFQALLEQHNLTAAQVEGTTAGSAKREKAAQAGGQYIYQRELWRAVARLNFCMYMQNSTWVKVGTYKQVYRKQHLVIGRVVNTRSTIAMATYLEQVTNRLCRDRLETRTHAGATPGEVHSAFFSTWAVGFREGVSDRVIQKLEERRSEALKEENRKKAAAARKGVSTATALTISTYKDAETDANVDFIYGEGTSARLAKERAERAAEQAEEERKYTAWAKANPKEAKKEADKWRKQREQRYSRPRAPTDAERRREGSGYWAGYDAGEGVSIDQQADSANTKRLS